MAKHHVRIFVIVDQEKEPTAQAYPSADVVMADNWAREIHKLNPNKTTKVLWIEGQMAKVIRTYSE